MVYIGLDAGSRTQGKAAVDVLGAQTGKSGGSVLQQVGAYGPQHLILRPLTATALTCTQGDVYDLLSSVCQQLHL